MVRGVILHSGSRRAKRPAAARNGAVSRLDTGKSGLSMIRNMFIAMWRIDFHRHDKNRAYEGARPPRAPWGYFYKEMIE